MELTQDGMRAVDDAARRHGVSPDAVLTLMRAVQAGGGYMAQFSHPELGGMGQWSQGGMIMVGDMFNQGLKARVDSLCNDLANILRSQTVFATSSTSSSWGGGRDWWPGELGHPSTAGGQNDLRYAWFGGIGRLAIDRGGQVTVYDTGDHQIGGVSQQQGGDQSLTFTSQYGLVRIGDLPVVGGGGQDFAPPPQQHQQQPPRNDAPPSRVTPSADDIFGKLEQLAGLHSKGILSDEEYGAKKAELLSRL